MGQGALSDTGDNIKMLSHLHNGKTLVDKDTNSRTVTFEDN
jgi:hypothetical protein